MSRVPRWLALVGLVGGSVATVTLTSPTVVSAGVVIDSDWCSEGRPAPCIESVHHGATLIAPDDAVWDVRIEEFDFDPGKSVRWTLWQNESDHLGPEAAGNWTVVMDTGGLVPRVVYGIGRQGSVTRIPDGDTFQVAATAAPTLVAEGCDNSVLPWTCQEAAASEAVRLSAEIRNEAQWEDTAQRLAFYGVNFWTNVVVNGFPAGVIYREATDAYEMRLDFAAPHFEQDESTVFHGHFELELPNDFLHEHFYIPDPTTMTTAGLAVAGGGPVSVTSVEKASASSPMYIEVTDMTFSTRKLRVATAVLVPTRPGDPTGTRVAAHRGRIGFETSTPRGAKVTGYKAACESAGGHSVSATRFEDASPVIVTSLREGVRYTCRVRALSKAGPSAWSTEVVVPRNP